MRWQRKLAVCNQEGHLEGKKNCFPKKRLAGENVSCPSPRFSFQPLSSTESMLDVLLLTSFGVSRSQPSFCSPKERYLQAVFVSFPCVWFFGDLLEFVLKAYVADLVHFLEQTLSLCWRNPGDLARIDQDQPHGPVTCAGSCTGPLRRRVLCLA